MCCDNQLQNKLYNLNKALFIILSVPVIFLISCFDSPSPVGTIDYIPTGALVLSTTQSSDIATIIRIPDKTNYEPGETVMMVATTNSGYTFTGWSGDENSTSDTITFVMDDSKTIYANFTNSSGKTVLSLVTSAENGTVTLSPEGGVYESGTTVFAYARPDYGFVFDRWTGAFTGHEELASLVINKSVLLTAKFSIDPDADFATLQIDPAPVNGKLVLDPAGFQSGNKHKYKPGTSITITAVADSGFELIEWGADLSYALSSVTSAKLTMDNDYTITATFSKHPDGENWKSLNSGNQNGLLSITQAGNQLVIVGNSGTILTSTDGETWTLRTTGVTTCLNHVIWTGKLFVCVGDGGTILTSSDGITWEKRNSTTEYHLQSVIWTGKQFVAVGGLMENSAENYSCILTSADGITWTNHSSGSGIWYSIAWNGNTLVGSGYDFDFSTVSDYSTSYIKTSANGTDWENSNTYIPREASFTSVIWTGTKFVAVGGSRSSEAYSSAYISKDGSTWEKSTIQTQSFMRSVVWTGSTLVAVGDDGMIYCSTNGKTWKRSESGTTDDIYGVTWTGTRLYAVGYGGLLLTSP